MPLHIALLEAVPAEVTGAVARECGAADASLHLIGPLTFAADAAESGIRGFLPSRAMCTDNAAMIAAAGWHRLRSDGPTGLDAGAYPNLRLAFMS